MWFFYELYSSSTSLNSMKLIILIVTSLFFVPFVIAETVYKTVDEHGNIVFSDKPTAGAEEIKIKEAQSFDIPDTKLFDYKSTREEEPESETQYSNLVITSPNSDSTIHSNEGNVNVSIEIEPALNEKDLLVLFMDGKQLAIAEASEFLLTNIDRGSHTIEVAIKNEKNKILLRSEKVVFHLRKMSKLFPNSPTSAPQNTGSAPPPAPIPTP